MRKEAIFFFLGGGPNNNGVYKGDYMVYYVRARVVCRVVGLPASGDLQSFWFTVGPVGVCRVYGLGLREVFRV